MSKLPFLLLLVALPLRADLGSQIRSANGWVGYSVPVIEGRHTVCSWDTVDEIDRDFNAPASELLVLFEVRGGKIETVRVSSPECRATHQVQWIRGVDPKESIRFLVSLIESDEGSVGKKAVTALALQRGSTDELIRLARDHQRGKIRAQALFWVSQQAGERAASVLRQAVDSDPETSVKTKAVFGIAQLPNDRSIPILIDLMKNHSNRSVRKKAAFWLGQKDDPRALAAFEDILAH